MKKIVAICFALCACICDTYADGQITLKCGASFREVPQDRCFSDTRTKTIGGVAYSYRIFKTNNSSDGLYEVTDSWGEKPIGLVLEKADFPSTIENINVPLTIDDIPVVKIGYDCFKRYSRLKSVALPKTVICIGGGAFEGCISLETITIPPMLVEIRGGAFKGCRKLKTKFVFNNDIDLGGGSFLWLP